jgi:hypothetical protein
MINNEFIGLRLEQQLHLKKMNMAAKIIETELNSSVLVKGSDSFCDLTYI